MRQRNCEKTGMLSYLEAELLSLLPSCAALSPLWAAPFSNKCSTQAYNNSRKLRLRCGYQIPWCDLSQTVELVTAAGEYALRYPGRRHPNFKVFQRLEQCLRERGNVTPEASVNADSPWTIWKPDNEDAIITAVEREQVPTIPTEGRRYISWRLIVFISLLAERISVSTIVLYGSNFANDYDINTL
jgi:hypothetical protein